MKVAIPLQICRNLVNSVNVLVAILPRYAHSACMYTQYKSVIELTLNRKATGPASHKGNSRGFIRTEEKVGSLS